jgi:hypothetical protein
VDIEPAGYPLSYALGWRRCRAATVHDLFTEVSYLTLEDHAVFREYLEKKLIRRQTVG